MKFRDKHNAPNKKKAFWGGAATIPVLGLLGFTGLAWLTLIGMVIAAAVMTDALEDVIEGVGDMFEGVGD